MCFPESVSDMRPLFFSLSSNVWITVYSYQMMLIISAIASMFIIKNRFDANNKGLLKWSIFIFSVLWPGIAGARILYFISLPDNAFSFYDLFNFTKGGVVAYGGFIGGAVGAIIASLLIHKPILYTLDMLAPAAALGIGFTRIGCFLAGCDYGFIASSPISLNYLLWDIPNETGAPAYFEHLHRGYISNASFISLPVLPWPLIASSLGFLLFIILYWRYNKRKFSGELFLLFFILYSLIRFFTEFLRGDSDRGTAILNTPFSFSQIISIVIFITALSVYIFLFKRTKLEKEPK